MLLILLSDTTQLFCLNKQTHDESLCLCCGCSLKRHSCEDHFNKLNGSMNLWGIRFVACINLNKIRMKMPCSSYDSSDYTSATVPVWTYLEGHRGGQVLCVCFNRQGYLRHCGHTHRKTNWPIFITILEVLNFVKSTALKAALVKSRTFPCREVLIIQLYFDNFSGLQMKTQSLFQASNLYNKYIFFFCISFAD